MLTLDALQFIHAFAPIISKAAMQTYYSALPLMPPESLLSKKYFAMSQPSLKLSKSSYSTSRQQIINHPQVMLPERLCYDSTGSDDIIALSRLGGGVFFFDTRTGNKISRISTPLEKNDCYLIAFSPDGKWIAIQNNYENALDIWDVKTCTHVKTIQFTTSLKPQHLFEHITYSADGEKIMVVTVPASFSFQVPYQLIFILDVKAGKPLKQFRFEAFHITISPDGSQIAINDKLGIKIIDVHTGHISRQITPSNDRPWTSNSLIIWSPNGQFLAFISMKQYKEKIFYSLTLTSASAQLEVPSFILLESSARELVNIGLACSPDSSKIVAVFCDYATQRITLYICCTQLGALIGTTSFGLVRENRAFLSFSADSQDILICAYTRFDPGPPQNPILRRFSVVPTHLETSGYMNHPPKFHPSQTLYTIQYSHHILGAINDYASQVDADGWILNTKGGREIWTPWANYKLSCSCKPPQEGQTQYRTLKVKDPKTKTVVLIYIIAFEQKDTLLEIYKP